MRIRSSTCNVPERSSHHYLQWNNSSNPTVDQEKVENILNDAETKYMEDVVTPNYRRRIASGAIINNPMKRLDTFEKFSGGAVYQAFIKDEGGGRKTGFKDTGVWKGCLYNEASRYKPVGSLSVSSVKDRAVTDAFAKCSVNEAEILATMGEMNETIASLRNIFKRAANIVLALKKFNLKRLAKECSPKELADRYMEARYALRPLVYDATNVMNALQKVVNHDRLTSRGGATETCTVTDEILLKNNMYYKIYATRNTVFTVTARAGVLASLTHVNALNVWGFDKILSSAWELVPLSFVLDWFFNVGRTIQAWEPKVGMSTLASWVTVEQTTIQTCTISRCEALWPTSSIIEKEITYSAMCYKITTNKERFTSLSPPVWPSFDVKLDTLKLLDLGLIIKNIF